MINFDTIKPSLQKDVISSFWTMMTELESQARNTDDAVLHVWVEGWYRQWNAMTGDNKQPAWMEKRA